MALTTETGIVGLKGFATLDNFIYVVDSGNHRIQKFDFQMRFILEWGGFGSADGRFNLPWGFASNGTLIFITDTGNNRIQVFDLDGNYQYQFGIAGSGFGEFNEPRGIVTRDGWLYVIDTENDRLQIFTLTGRFAMSYGILGSGVHEFDTPIGCAIDGNYLLIDDRGNQRIVTVILRYVDPNFVPPPIELPRNVKKVYRFSLSGSQDGTTDIDLPMKNFSASMRLEGVTTLNVTIPFSTEIESQVNARPDGLMSIFQQFVSSDGSVDEVFMFSANLEDITPSVGPRNASIVLRGRKSTTFDGLDTVLINDVLFRTVTNDKNRYRIAPNALVLPNNTAVIDGNNILIGNVTLSVGSPIETMEFEEQ